MRGISFTTQQRTLNLAREITTDPLHPLWSEYVLFTSGPRNAPDAAWKRHRTVCPAERSAAQQAANIPESNHAMPLFNMFFSAHCAHSCLFS